MDVEIDTFKPHYLEQQVKLGQAIRSDWPLGGQTPLDRLEKAYSSPEFDPESKFYAVMDDEVVGFVTTSITGDTASLAFPIVKDNNSEIGRLLLDHVLDRLKERGVTTVTARASGVWGKTEVYAQGYHFEPVSIQLAQGTRLVRALPKVEEDPTETLDLDADRDLIRDIFVDKLEYTRDHLDSQLAILQKEPQLVMDWRIMQEEDIVYAHGVVINDPPGSDQAYLFHFYIDPERKEHASDFIETILADLDREQLEYIHVVLAREQTQFLALFEDLGFTFAKIMQYRKSL